MEPSDELIKASFFSGLVFTALAPVVKGLLNILVGATTRPFIVKGKLRGNCALAILCRVVVKYLPF